MASTINLTLPESLSRYVASQVEAGDFGTPSQYLRELILRDQVRNQLLLESLLELSQEEEDAAIEIPQEVLDGGDIVGFLEDQAKRLQR